MTQAARRVAGGPLLTALLAACFATGIVLADASTLVIPWADIARPVVLTAVVSAMIGLVAGIAFTPHRAAVIAVLAAVGIVRPLIAVGIVAAFLVWVLWRRRRAARLHHRERAIAEAVLGLRVGGLALAVTTLTSTLVIHGLPSPAVQHRVAEAMAPGESVYVLLLDGYPRADTLLGDFGYDNQPFLDALTARGFVIDPESESLYHWTPLAIAHLLGAEVEPSEREPTADGYRRNRDRINSAPLPDLWRAEGYDVTIVRSAVGHVTRDDSVGTGEVTDFEVSLLGRSLLAPLVGDWIVAQQRDRLDESLRTVVSIAGSDGSHIVIAHLMAPHAPVLTGPPPSCWATCGLWNVGLGMHFPGDQGAYSAAMRGQLDYLNPRILSALDAVIAADPAAAVAVFSDHGNRFRPLGDPSWNLNFFAIRGTPSVDIPFPLKNRS